MDQYFRQGKNVTFSGLGRDLQAGPHKEDSNEVVF